MSDRSWMYRRLDDQGCLTDEFVMGLQLFINFACSQPAYMDGDKIRCPCRKCKHRRFDEVDSVKFHLVRSGFVADYLIWNRHGETYIPTPAPIPDPVAASSSSFQFHENTGWFNYNEPVNPYQQMVNDAAGPSFQNRTSDENPNPEDQRFYDMLAMVDKELWPGCEKVTQLSALARLMTIKAEDNISENCFNNICQLMKDSLPEDNLMVDSFYDTKKLVKGLGLPAVKIDCCRNGCMLFWADDNDIIQCRFCGDNRYKPSSRSQLIPYKQMRYLPLTPRLKRLFASEKTAAFMRWHAEHQHNEAEVMCHPSDSEAWKHFDRIHPSFAADSRNVRLGLCTDGFQPFGQSGQQYSCWPIILTPYNLPPSMCMKEPYMFLTAIVPGPNNPKHKIDVYLQPVIAELNELWLTGVLTFDVSLKQNFQLRAALMWTISDFPAYSMLSGWSTAGKLACPYCMEDSQAFSLQNGGKVSWFDSHRKFLPHDHPFRRNKRKFMKNIVESRDPPQVFTGEEILQEIEHLGLVKVTEIDADEINGALSNVCGWKKRSIFWDLPYWKTNLIRHNLDVMHIEKNVFENVFNTVMDIKGKTKDNAKARADLKLYFHRKELEINPSNGKYVKACYTLSREQRQVLCQWVKDLKFPDGYVSQMGRCVDMRKYKMFGMKSHDCHVFMQRLLPIAFREMLPNKVWESLTELSCFFKNLTTTTITTEDMERLEAEIAVIICKLEMIFVPGFFDSMEHLPIHLPYEAKIAGPVQYRWMYPFERLLRVLKKSVKNKARVEGSICNAYLVRETSTFCSHYFEPHVLTRDRRVPRNDFGDAVDEPANGNLSIFTHPSRLHGRVKTRNLSNQEYKAAHVYILLNCDEVQPFIRQVLRTTNLIYQTNVY